MQRVTNGRSAVRRMGVVAVGLAFAVVLAIGAWSANAAEPVVAAATWCPAACKLNCHGNPCGCDDDNAGACLVKLVKPY
jgi:hypothetical protein